ncbi:MAG: Hpt domain protein [Gemmatimonadetes bacterium]|nr:Hpt domain protein [Gemmatimonadota bacterium]
MTAPTPVGYLDFFILEAGDYVQQLDAVLLDAASNEPDVQGLQRVARALRGSATMAKLTSFSELAAGIERVGRALHEGALTWNVGLSGVLVSAVDDCKVLLHNVRAWGDADEVRARRRIRELSGYAAARDLTPLATPTMQGHDSYLANEAANIGAGLELLATRPSDRDAAVNVVRRVRALRGIASVKDHPAFAEVLEASEQAAHHLEAVNAHASAERVALLSAASNLLRAHAFAMRSGNSVDDATPESSGFNAALDALQASVRQAERIIPIASLFYQDGGATIVETSSHPPMTPAQRFRVEAVSHGEHLARLVGEARAAADDAARDRARRGLRQALNALSATAESFGADRVASFVAAQHDGAGQLDKGSLEILEDIASLLVEPGSDTASLDVRFNALRAARTSAEIAASTASLPPVAMPALALAAAAADATPASVKRADLLAVGLKNLGGLSKTPLSAPIAVEEQPPVSIDVLLYRGRAAIERCVEIRDGARRNGGNLDADARDELFDLLDLALTN